MDCFLSMRHLITLGCLTLLLANGKCIKFISLSSVPEEILEFDSITLTCIIQGLETKSFSHWKNFTNDKSEPTIGFNGDICIATGFLNDTNRFSWTCNNNSFSLTIKRVTRKHHMEAWRCRHEFTASNNITLLVKVPVEKVKLFVSDGKNTTVIENKTIEFVCQTSYCRPAADVVWFICSELCHNVGTKIIAANYTSSETLDSNGFISTNSTLELSPDRSKHGWHVFCSASNMGFTNQSSNELILNIIYPPRYLPKIIGYEHVYRVIENDQANLTCSITGGNPLPDLVLECYNGSSVKNSNDSTIILSVLWVAKREQTGKCVCSSVHVGGNQSVDMNVEVLFPPDVPNLTIDSHNVEYSINKIIDSSLVIKCNSKGNPSPNFIWLLPDSSISNGEVLEISKIDMSNNGTYYCKTENMMEPSNGNTESGKSEVSIDVHILFPPTTPDLRFGGSQGPVIQIDSIFIVESDSINVSCSSSGNPKPNCSFSNSSGDVNSIELLNITSDTNITCTASNTMKGFGGSSKGRADKYLSIKVLYPPRIPIVLYKMDGEGIDECISENEIFNVREFKSFTLICNSKAKPNASFSWYGPITTTSKDLVAYNITRDKDGAFSCYAFNTMKRTFGNIERGENHRKVNLNILYPPTIGLMANISVIEGSAVNVSCPVSPGNPDITNVSWTRIEENSNWASKELYIRQVKRKDNGDYECIAFNKMYPTCENEILGEARRRFYLNVVYKTKVTYLHVKGKIGLNPVSLHEKDSFEIICQTESNPTSMITIYFKEKVLINKSDVNTLTFSKHSALCSDDGIYTCVGRNIHNVKEPSRSHLTVHILCSPRPSPEVAFRQYILTSIRKTVTLTFTAMAHPVPTKAGYKWLKEQEGSIWIYLQDDGHYNIVIVGLQTNLTITDITLDDFGKYRLIIENSIGIYDQTFYIVGKVPPIKPSNFEIANDSLSNTSVTLSWKPLKNYDMEQTFILQYKDDFVGQFTSINISDNGESVMNYTIMNMTSNRWFLAQISAVNAFGRSDNMVIRFQTKSKPTSPKDLMAIEHSITETSLVVQWEPGNDGGDRQSFAINYKKIKGDWITILTAGFETNDQVMSQYIDGLNKGTSYQLYLIAINSYGHSNKSEIIQFQTKPFDSYQYSTNQPHITWILTGLLAALTLAIVSIISFVFFRRKRLCHRLLNKTKDKQDRISVNSTKGAYVDVNLEIGTEMVALRQKYEKLETRSKGNSSTSKLGIYDDIDFPATKAGEESSKRTDVGYEVPAALSDKNKLISNNEKDIKSKGQYTNLTTEYVNLEL